MATDGSLAYEQPEGASVNINEADLAIPPPMAFNPNILIANPNPPQPPQQPGANMHYQAMPPQMVNPNVAPVQYVDQNGNPIQFQQNNAVRYVDQFGNPIHMPSAAPPQYVYAKPPSNLPIAPLLPPKKAGRYEHLSKQEKIRRKVATVGGIITMIFIIAALANGMLADGTDYSCDFYEVNVHTSAGWPDDPTPAPTSYPVWSPSTYDGDSVYYSDGCDNYFDTDTYPYSTDDWCSTWAGASLFISFAVGALGFTFCGVLWSQTLCWMSRGSACKDSACNCPRIFYIIALGMSCIAIAGWYNNDQICMATDRLDLAIGASVYWMFAVAFLICVNCAIAR